MEHQDRRPSPGPELSVGAVFNPADPILSTIDSDALLTAASPEEEVQEEEKEQEEKEQEDEEQEERVRESKMKMKMRPRQEPNSSSCVLLERQRR